jgi:hypothetical protein
MKAIARLLFTGKNTFFTLDRLPTELEPAGEPLQTRRRCKQRLPSCFAGPGVHWAKIIAPPHEKAHITVGPTLT